MCHVLLFTSFLCPFLTFFPSLHVFNLFISPVNVSLSLSVSPPCIFLYLCVSKFRIFWITAFYIKACLLSSYLPVCVFWNWVPLCSTPATIHLSVVNLLRMHIPSVFYIVLLEHSHVLRVLNIQRAIQCSDDGNSPETLARSFSL